MAIKMLMPLLGQTMEEGTIIRWFKNEGDSVKEGEPLLEVLTDKVNMEVEAPESGVLRKIFAQTDDIVPVKDPIAIIGTADESIDDLLGDSPVAQPAVEEAAPIAQAPATTSVPLVTETAQPTTASIPVTGEAPIASPSAKRVAREHGIEISALAGRGTGPNGRIVEKDVLDYASSTKATPLAGKVASEKGVDLGSIAGSGVGGKVMRDDVDLSGVAPASGIGATIPFNRMRKIVAQNLQHSAQNAVHVTLVTEVDMTECARARKKLVAESEKTYGMRISFTDIIAHAAAKAVLQKPIVNASLQEDKIVIADSVNIGIATSIEGGLIVPVIKNAHAKSLINISKEIKALAERARSSKATPDDLSGGTFTITNLGMYGIDSFTPIITPGQSAILAVCRIVEKPVIIDGGIKIRSMMNLCLSFDHRIMDGAPAAEYLSVLRGLLENPDWISL